MLFLELITAVTIFAVIVVTYDIGFGINWELRMSQVSPGWWCTGSAVGAFPQTVV